MMTGVRLLSMLAISLIIASIPVNGYAHEPSGQHETTPDTREAAMQAQHERMENFRSAAQTLCDAIIRNDSRMTMEGTEQLRKSLEGHEKDVPHKNRQHAKEFHALYVELGKRTEKMKAAIRSNDLSKAAASYGQVLAVCAACHKKFRD